MCFVYGVFTKLCLDKSGAAQGAAVIDLEPEPLEKEGERRQRREEEEVQKG